MYKFKIDKKTFLLATMLLSSIRHNSDTNTRVDSDAAQSVYPDTSVNRHLNPDHQIHASDIHRHKDASQGQILESDHEYQQYTKAQKKISHRDNGRVQIISSVYLLCIGGTLLLFFCGEIKAFMASFRSLQHYRSIHILRQSEAIICTFKKMISMKKYNGLHALGRDGFITIMDSHVEVLVETLYNTQEDLRKDHKYGTLIVFILENFYFESIHSITQDTRNVLMLIIDDHFETA